MLLEDVIGTQTVAWCFALLGRPRASASTCATHAAADRSQTRATHGGRLRPGDSGGVILDVLTPVHRHARFGALYSCLLMEGREVSNCP